MLINHIESSKAQDPKFLESLLICYGVLLHLQEDLQEKRITAKLLVEISRDMREGLYKK